MADIKFEGASLRLQEAISEQKNYLQAYESPSPNRAYETIRVLDDLNCRELMFPNLRESSESRLYRSVSTWGVNQALRRIIPRPSSAEVFVPHRSSAGIQSQADDFVFNCGVLELAQRYDEWLREGVVSGEVKIKKSIGENQVRDILILQRAIASYSDEEIGLSGLRWAGYQIWRKDRLAERALEHKYLKFRKRMQAQVCLVDGWKMVYSPTPEINNHFLEWGKLYLKRIFSQDLIGPDDIIGGRPFSRYVDVLNIISAMSQKHLAFAAILGGSYESVKIRNLLTNFSDRKDYITSIAKTLDADCDEVSGILKSFVLTSDNLDFHTKGGETAWAPIIQVTQGEFILPAYGIDVNPFLFLMNDLRNRYEKDWFKVANDRERRWIAELDSIFQGDRYNNHLRNLRLRENGKDLTDIDFAVFDRKNNELGIFQLKWQHPIGSDNRTRRSAGKNLIKEGNKWVRVVCDWLDRHGIEELARRLNFDIRHNPKVNLFVLGRYNVHLTGYDDRDDRATWSDWAHFRRAKVEGHRKSPSQIAGALRSTLAQAATAKKGECFPIPVGSLDVILNPAN